MATIYLEPEDSEFIRSALQAVTPFSPDCHELLARAAVEEPDGQVGRDAMELLTQEGYLGVEVRGGVPYLGLPRYVSRPLIEALSIVYARRNPEAGQPVVRSVLSIPPEEFPDVYIAIPINNPYKIG
ncbi:MAG: hypothetical protein HYY37_02525 [Candidatus Aenigmarchaeota archaeon]|nr:hypothetical protein [Candidatus Aenigmarchaeota archaeon]